MNPTTLESLESASRRIANLGDEFPNASPDALNRVSALALSSLLGSLQGFAKASLDLKREYSGEQILRSASATVNATIDRLAPVYLKG